MKIVRYFFVGGVAAGLDITVFGILTKGLGLPWFSVAVFSFVLANIVNYLLSIWYVFNSGVRFSRHHEVFWVFVVSGVGLVFNQAILWALIERLTWDLLLAKIAATSGVFLWNYGVRRNFIFKAAA